MGEGEMGVVVEAETVVADVVCGVDCLGHGAYGKSGRGFPRRCP